MNPVSILLILSMVFYSAGDPLNTSRKQFLLGIDGHNVRPQRANASIRAEGDLWHQSRIKFIKPFKLGDRAALE